VTGEEDFISASSNIGKNVEQNTQYRRAEQPLQHKSPNINAIQKWRHVKIQNGSLPGMRATKYNGIKQKSSTKMKIESYGNQRSLYSSEQVISQSRRHEFQMAPSAII
jgi:hypothetical protein